MDTEPQHLIDADTPQCKAILESIDAYRAAYRTQPLYASVSPLQYQFALAEVRARTQDPDIKTFTLDNVPVIVAQMHPMYERGKGEALH